MKEKFYAVKKGLTPGIYNSWEECKTQVDGYSGAEFKSFKTLSDARSWLGFDDISEVKDLSNILLSSLEANCAIAYVDGSFRESTGMFSYGVVFFCENEEKHFSRSFSNADMISMRNVSGEIMGAAEAMRQAVKRGCKKLTIYHDYEGIAKWCTGEWKANKEYTQKYRDYYKKISSVLEINFIKVKAHSNDTFNELADQLAKKALE